ncbi:hypothetical protein BMF35_a0237 [Aurantiacibacter gangjinensis]|nr:hypothetical protein BMF35_a0237 [Aurantiacibacter gangjinensis]
MPVFGAPQFLHRIGGNGPAIEVVGDLRCCVVNTGLLPLVTF